MSQYQSNPGPDHWIAVKNILKYLRRTKDMFLIYGGNDEALNVTGYVDARWNSDHDDSKSQTGFVFLVNGGAVSWNNKKQPVVAQSSMESEYIAAVDAANEAVWLRNFVIELGVFSQCARPHDNLL